VGSAITDADNSPTLHAYCHLRMAASMTWMKSSSCMDLLRAATLWRPLWGKTRHRGGRWKLPGASGEVELGWLAVVAAKAEEGMSQHDQSHMPVQPGPEPAFIIVQPQFSFGRPGRTSRLPTGCGPGPPGPGGSGSPIPKRFFCRQPAEG